MVLVMQMGFRMDGVKDRTFGLYIKEYDPFITKEEEFLLTVTDDLQEARKFSSLDEVNYYYLQISPNIPKRPTDGEPNRPLTAWCINVLPLPSSYLH